MGDCVVTVYCKGVPGLLAVGLARFCVRAGFFFFLFFFLWGLGGVFSGHLVMFSWCIVFLVHCVVGRVSLVGGS